MKFVTMNFLVGNKNGYRGCCISLQNDRTRGQA